MREISLNGLWTAASGNGVSDLENWARPENWPQEKIPVNVPFQTPPPIFRSNSDIWLFTTFNITFKSGLVPYLVFYGADQGHVYLNGQPAGSLKRSPGKQQLDVSGLLLENNYLAVHLKSVKPCSPGIWRCVMLIFGSSVRQAARSILPPPPPWLNSSIILSLGPSSLPDIPPDSQNKQIIRDLKSAGINTIILDNPVYSGEESQNNVLSYSMAFRSSGFRVIYRLSGRESAGADSECHIRSLQYFSPDGLYLTADIPADDAAFIISGFLKNSIDNNPVIMNESDQNSCMTAKPCAILENRIKAVLDLMAAGYYEYSQLSDYVSGLFQYYPENCRRIIPLEDPADIKPVYGLAQQVLRFFLPGIPMVRLYGSQNLAGLINQPAWKYYRKLFQMKRRIRALNEQHLDRFHITDRRPYLEILRAHSGRTAMAVLDTMTHSINVVRNGREYFSFNNL